MTGRADDAPGGDAEPEVQRHSLRRNASALLGSQLIGWVLAIGLTSFQSRLLGPEGLGKLRIAHALWGIAGVFIGAGADRLITVELARSGKSNTLLNRVIALQSIIYALAWPIVLTFAVIAGYGSSVLLTVTLIGLSILPAAISDDARAAFYGLERMSQPSAIDIANRVLATVLIVVVLSAGGRVQASAIILIVTSVFHAVLMGKLLRRTTGMRLRPSFSGLGAVARAGAPFLLLDSTVVVYQQVDTVIMSLLINNDEIGYYGAASQLFGTLLFIPTVLMTTVFPVFARLDATDPQALTDLTRRGMRFLILAGVPLGFGTIVIARPVCTLLFGSDFTPAGDVLAFYGLVLVMMFPLILLSQYAIATGRQSRWTVMILISIVLTVPLDLLTVPWARHLFGHGAAGGAMSYVVTETVMLVVACLTIVRHIMDRSILRRAITCLAIGAVMLGAIWPLRHLPIPVPVVVGAVVYAVLLAGLRVLDAEETALVRAFATRVLGAVRRGAA